MFCEPYRKPLIEAAASGEPLPRALQAHVDTCAECASALRQELVLFAKVDELARAAANGEVSSSFLPRVRAEIEEVAKTKRVAMTWLAPAVAAAAVLVLSISALIHQPVTRSTHQTSSESASLGSQSKAAIRMESNVSPSVPIRRKQLRSKPAKETSNSPQAKTAVAPRDEREALLIFAAQLRSRPELARAFATPESSSRNEGLEIPPVRIEELKLRPLQDEGGEEDKAELDLLEK